MRPGEVTPRFKAPLPAKKKRYSSFRRKPVEETETQRLLAVAKVIVAQRSKGRCEARIAHECQGRAVQYHHIKRRSQGGSNASANLLHVCSTGHLAIHANPAEAFAVGDLRPGWA